MSTLALVSPEDVQIVSVYPMDDGSGHTEVFTRVLFGEVVVQQEQGKPNLAVDGPTLAEDEALLDVWTSLEDFRAALPTANLLAYGWEHALLQLGDVKVTAAPGARPPSAPAT